MPFTAASVAFSTAGTGSRGRAARRRAASIGSRMRGGTRDMATTG